ncbi:hypothetical protein F511_20860 [Dorcoceras hygrometricum]|uniref:Uncharacterized protein n=1 Tax=Dorcoceras hygrometricum TaxID=472368 RepID=A0A2Z7AKT9_9LAMI|nr:hypothetical protein F511_20860 [Dorcoceras hygrometricum]
MPGDTPEGGRTAAAARLPHRVRRMAHDAPASGASSSDGQQLLAYLHVAQSMREKQQPIFMRVAAPSIRPPCATDARASGDTALSSPCWDLLATMRLVVNYHSSWARQRQVELFVASGNPGFTAGRGFNPAGGAPGGG